MSKVKGQMTAYEQSLLGDTSIAKEQFQVVFPTSSSLPFLLNSAIRAMSSQTYENV